jgi:hypothetical protein
LASESPAAAWREVLEEGLSSSTRRAMAMVRHAENASRTVIRGAGGRFAALGRFEDVPHAPFIAAGRGSP